MSLMGSIAKFFGLIGVVERQNKVHVTGIDGTILQTIIATLWDTSVFNKQMFTSVSTQGFVFHRFFVPDVVYMLTKIALDPKSSWGVKNSVDKILAGLVNNTWYKCTISDYTPMVDLKRLRRVKWKPMPKQIEFLHLYGELMPKYDLRGYILGFAPGGGKTLADLFLATCVIPPSIAEVKIIISPKKALHLVWEDTVRKVFVKTPSIWCSDSNTPMPIKNTEYYIFNYEAMDKALELADSLKTRKVRYFVIVDESHNFADFKSSRTQKLIKLQTMAPNTYFVWTSGTPVLKHGAELVSFLRCADPRFDDEAERIFRKIWTAAPGRANEIFNHRLGKMMAFMVPKSEFSKTKPKVVELPIKLPSSLSKKFLMSSVREEMKVFIEQRLTFYATEMAHLRSIVNTWFEHHAKSLTSTPQTREWNQYVTYIKLMSRNPDLDIVEAKSYCRRYERIKLLPSIPPRSRREFRHALSAIKNLKMKVRGEALGTVLSKRRSECAAALGIFCKPEEIMKNSLSKTLFFASSVAPVRILAKYLEDRGFEPMMVYGGTNSQLTTMMRQFESNAQINPVCATMQSLSEAVPVTAASTVVLLNRPFRQAVWDQVVARADRLGQLHPVTVVEVTLDTGSDPNVSSTTDDILGYVRESINAIVGPEFAGPDPDEREYQTVIDASKENTPELDLDTLTSA